MNSFSATVSATSLLSRCGPGEDDSGDAASCSALFYYSSNARAFSAASDSNGIAQIACLRCSASRAYELIWVSHLLNELGVETWLMRGCLAAFLLDISIESASLSTTAGISADVGAVGEHGALWVIGAVLDLSSCELLLAVSALHGDSVAPNFPENASPAEMVLLPDKGNELIDFPGAIHHVLGNNSPVEVDEDLCFLALHPLALLQCEQLAAVGASVEL